MRLAVFITHPIAYYSPLWRSLTRTPGLEVVVHYFSDCSVRGGLDRGFGVDVTCDVPLLDGHEHVFLDRDAPVDRPNQIGLRDAAGLLARGGFDAVLLNGYMHRFARQVVRAARKAGIRTLLRTDFSDVVPDTGRSPLKKLVRNAYLRWFYRHVDAFCYTGVEGKEHLERRRIPEDRMFLSPCSIDDGLFENQSQSFSRERSRAELGIGDDQKVLIFSGKFIPRKAPLLLLEALRMTPALDDVVVIFVGDGPLRDEVEEASKMILGSRYRMPGFVNQSQLGKYYAASDIFVLPARFDVWGLVVNEAMMFGLPVVVSSKVGCHRDLVVAGTTGFTFVDGDAQSLAARITALLADPLLVARMGRAARERVIRFGIESTAEGVKNALGLNVRQNGIADVDTRSEHSRLESRSDDAARSETPLALRR